jgi:hypothetical protein
MSRRLSWIREAVERRRRKREKREEDEEEEESKKKVIFQFKFFFLHEILKFFKKKSTQPLQSHFGLSSRYCTCTSLVRGSTNPL